MRGSGLRRLPAARCPPLCGCRTTSKSASMVRSLAGTIALLAAALPAPLSAQQRVCQQTETPKQLPDVSALLDSAGAISGLTAIDAPEGMLFSLVFREGDSLPLVRPLFGTDSTAGAILARSIRSQKPS